MTFCRRYLKPAESDFQLVDLPVFPSYVLGWEIRPASAQPGRLVWVVDNRVAPGGYGTRDVGFYLDLVLTDGSSTGIPLYPFDPEVLPSVTVPAGELAVFEVDSYLPGVKLDLSHAAGVFMSIESRTLAGKTKVGVFCGAPLSHFEWWGMIV